MNSSLLAATTAPIDDPTQTFYSPGVLGFVFTFGLAAIVIFLIIDMVRRMRRVRYREEIKAKLASEAADSGTKRNK